jgi:hypothetical protein
MAWRRGAGAAAWCDGLLDGVVLLLGTWTLVYHVCLVARLGVTPALVLEVLALAGAGVLLWRRRSAAQGGPDGVDADPPPGPPRQAGVAGRWSGRSRFSRLTVVTVALALVTAIAMALDAPFVLVWVPWLGSSVAGAVWALDRWRSARAVPAAARPGSFEAYVALAWALGLGVFSWWVLNSNPDDVFYLNLSQEVASHGDFPLRDTLYSHLAFPMANWPPVASYDPLVGVVGRLLHVHAAGVAYLGVLPLATTLSVLALWRLLRAWRVPSTALALSVALVFLLVDGGTPYGTPGNLFVTRLWQGKVILLCLLVPLLLVYALRYVERPAPARLVPLALASLAAIGLSTTGIFLVPVIAVGSMAPLLLRAPRRAAAGFAALAVYPIGTGVVSIAVDGHSADDFGDRLLYRFDPSWIAHTVFLSGGLALVGVLCVLLGALLVPHPAARLTTGLLVLATGLVFIPGVTRAAYDLTGLGPTLWRLSWVATVPALVGVASVTVIGAARRRFPDLRRRWVNPVAIAVALGLAAVIGVPIWGEPSTGASVRAPFHWQRPTPSMVAAHEVLGVLHSGDRVLAPQGLAVTLAISSSDLRSIVPREYYLDYLHHDPAFDYRDRHLLYDFVNGIIMTVPDDLPGALRRLHVDIVCMLAPIQLKYDALLADGYRPLVAAAGYRCLRRA